MEQAIFESVALKLKFNNNIFHIIGEDRLSGGLVLGTVGTSASKSSIRRLVITEKAPTRAFSWLKALRDRGVNARLA